MKLASYVRRGEPGFGAVVENGIVDLTEKVVPGIATIKQLLEADEVAFARQYVEGRGAELSWSDVSFLPVIPDPAKILCIGVNYLDHKKETGRPDVHHPTVFTRFADTQVGHRQPMIKPEMSDRFDYEGEMAVIIGTAGRHIPEGRAMSHVAGFACYNDGSIRDFQRHTSQFTPGKNFPGTGAFGPFMTTADEIEDHTTLAIETRLNGTVMQQATLADLLFPLEKLIAYCSTFTPLAPGDVIVTGTPGGVGDKRTPPVYLQPGDTVEVSVSQLGTLVNPVMSEAM